MKKILILGSSGILGSQLVKNLSKKYIILHNGIKKRKYDLTKYSSLENLLNKNKPDLIINCIAITNIEFCEKNKKKTLEINFIISKNIFEIKKNCNLSFKYLFISTDQVYNNSTKSKELSKVKIYNFYTKSKFLAERITLKNKGIVLRTNFFGKVKNRITFTDWVLDKFKNKSKNFYLINDIHFSPLRIITICRAINKLIVFFPKNSEIFNLGSATKLTKKEFAIYFAKKMNIYKKNYISVSYKHFLKVKRPNYMSMNSKKFERYFNFKINSLENELDHESKIYKNKK